MTWEALESAALGTPDRPACGECHVWVTRVGDHDRGWARLLQYEDLAYVRRHQVDKDRKTIVASRGLQRFVAGHYLNLDPRQVVIKRQCEHCLSWEHGRPWLQDGDGLDYSVSHAGDWVVVAVVASGRVGVDLERCDSLEDVEELAETVLTAQEAVDFLAVPLDGRPRWFYQAWVRKEAVLKLTGRGLGIEPDLVDVRDEMAVGLVDLLPAAPVRLRDLVVPDSYCAALASTVATSTVAVHRVGVP